MPPAACVSYDDAPAAHAEDTPDTPTIDSLVDLLNEAFPRDDRPWAAGDTLKNVLVVLKHPDGTREPLAIGVPGDREVDQKRSRPAPAHRGRAHRRGRVRQVPGAGQGLHRSRGAGGGVEVGHPLPRRPAPRRGHPLGHRRQRPRLPRHRHGRGPRLHARRHDRGRRRPRRRPLPQLPEGTLESARGIEMGHIFQLGRVRRALGLQGARRERQARHRHDGLLRHRSVARRGRDRRGHARRDRPLLAAQRRSRRRPRRRRRQGRGDLRLRRGAVAGPVGAGRRGALRRPRRQGQPGREVQGRRAHRRTDDRHRRPRTRRRQRRGPRPPHRRARGGRGRRRRRPHLGSSGADAHGNAPSRR